MRVVLCFSVGQQGCDELDFYAVVVVSGGHLEMIGPRALYTLVDKV
jgi:hypothetical protein